MADANQLTNGQSELQPKRLVRCRHNSLQSVAQYQSAVIDYRRVEVIL